jgi:hypothetical protein
MSLSNARARDLAARLDVTFDGVCLACLSLVSAAVRSGDERELSRWVRRMTSDLWSDGVDDIAIRWVRDAVERDDPAAAQALADLEGDGPRSPVARAIVRRLGEELAAEERLGRDVLGEVMEPFPARRSTSARVRAVRNGSDGTRTRDLRRDRPAF